MKAILHDLEELIKEMNAVDQMDDDLFIQYFEREEAMQERLEALKDSNELRIRGLLGKACGGFWPAQRETVILQPRLKKRAMKSFSGNELPGVVMLNVLGHREAILGNRPWESGSF